MAPGVADRTGSRARSRGAVAPAGSGPALTPATAALSWRDWPAWPSAWANQTLTRVNDSVVRLGILQGEFHWPKHDAQDEFFSVVEGRFAIDLEGRSVDLRPRQGFTVPKGVLHRTRAPERSVVLMVEQAGVVPTGE